MFGCCGPKTSLFIREVIVKAFWLYCNYEMFSLVSVKLLSLSFIVICF